MQMDPGGRPTAWEESLAHPQDTAEAPHLSEQAPSIQEQLTRGATASLMAASANVSRTVDRHYIETGGKSSKQGRPPDSHPDEEEPLTQCIWTRALIGRGLTRDAWLAAWEKYILVLSPARQDQTRAFCLVEQSRGKKKKRVFHLLSRRWPSLKRYPVRMLEQARAENSRPEVLANCFDSWELARARHGDGGGTDPARAAGVPPQQECH